MTPWLSSPKPERRMKRLLQSWPRCGRKARRLLMTSFRLVGKQQTEGLKQQNEELELSSAQVLAAGFDAALEQVACQYSDLDLSMVSLYNEVVDG